MRHKKKRRKFVVLSAADPLRSLKAAVRADALRALRDVDPPTSECFHSAGRI